MSTIHMAYCRLDGGRQVELGKTDDGWLWVFERQSMFGEEGPKHETLLKVSDEALEAMVQLLMGRAGIRAKWALAGDEPAMEGLS